MNELGAVYEYIIPEIPPSNNKYIGRTNRWEYQATKKRWADNIAVYCKPRPTSPIPQAVVKIKYYFADRRRRDPDNYSGKMLLDGLVRAGILQDDSFANIDLQLSAGYDKDLPRVVIEIEEV